MAAAVAFILLSGCVATNGTNDRTLSKNFGDRAPGETTDAGFELEVLGEQRRLLQTTGTGWMSLRLTALEDVKVNVSLSNPALPVLDRFTPEGKATYSAGNYTFVYLFRDGEFPGGPKSYYFEWMGSPAYTAPRQARENGTDPTPPPFDLPAGKRATLLILSTVPNYLIQLDTLTSKEQGRSQIDLPLKPHPGIFTSTPIPQDLQGQVTPVGPVTRRLVWTTGPLEVGPSVLRAWAWTIEEGLGTGRLGVYHDELGFHGPPEGTLQGTPEADYMGPETSRSNSAFAVAPAPGSFEMFRLLDETSAGYQNVIVGATFAVIPLPTWFAETKVL